MFHISRRKLARMKLARMASGIALSALALSGSAQAANQLQQIDANAMPGDQVQLRLKLSDSAPQPLTFTVDNPARISLDLADTSIALPSRRIDVKRGVLDTVNVAEANGRTRVVLNLNTMVPYETRVEGDTVIVTVGSSVQANGKATNLAAPASSSTNTASVARGAAAINKIDFRRGTDGSGGSHSYFAEAPDGRATADWIAEQTWFDGRLGSYGASYMGFTQWALASTRPPQ